MASPWPLTSLLLGSNHVILPAWSYTKAVGVKIAMRSIAPLSLTQLYERYVQLGAQLQRGEISHDQFVAQAHQLQAQDATGGWWTIDPLTGSYMTYTAQGWVNATPPPSSSPAQQGPPARVDSAPSQGPPSAPPRQSSGGLRGCFGSPIMTLLLSVGAALVWFAYTSLSPRSESLDLVTPLVIGGTPFLLRLLQKPLDRLLGPLYKLLNLLPRPLLVGAALAVPLVVGGILTNSEGSGYGGLQRSAFTSVVLSYVLTRRPGASA